MHLFTNVLDGNVYRVYDGSQYLAKDDDITSFKSVLDGVNSGDEYIVETEPDVEYLVDAGEELNPIFDEAAKEYNISADLLKAVGLAESGFDTNAVSSCNAMGIMQLMPSACDSFGVSNPFDARDNIFGGARVLSWLMERYNNNATLALAAYNSGYGNVDKYGGVPPFSETERFINKINESLGGLLDNDSKTIDGTRSNTYNIYEQQSMGYNRFI